MKKSPVKEKEVTKSVLNVHGKRESEYDIEKMKKKKFKPKESDDESDFDISDFDYEKMRRTLYEDKIDDHAGVPPAPSARPKRNAAPRKALVISDDEDDKGKKDDDDNLSLAIDIEDNDEDFVV